MVAVAEPCEFLRVRDVAVRLGVSESRVYQMAAQSAIPVARFAGGRALRVPRAAFERWLEEQTEAALASVRR
ncbi:MAG TPA: helix-turn-helix domain-containing protein [Chloroflexota bacterium]|nr:helix-turn-helix domain-containing protein [Chloroflexota bacterium]